ncbi:hypothetical protein [Ralstonia sp. 1138]|uniref:hypothetical protein n=1 Tax=Ralstonia sp. 1138 TaxID=3156423 RepID=UPI0033976A4D
MQQPVNTPSAGKRQPAAHDLPRRQIDLHTSKTTGVLWSRYRRSAGITQIGAVPIPRTIEVMLLAWTHLATAAAVMTMAMTRVGTRKSGMLEGPVLNA